MPYPIRAGNKKNSITKHNQFQSEGKIKDEKIWPDLEGRIYL